MDLEAVLVKTRKALDCELRLEKANQDTVQYTQGWNEGCDALVQGLLRCAKTKGSKMWVTGLDISQMHQAVSKE